jgi:hypothetical protein
MKIVRMLTIAPIACAMLVAPVFDSAQAKSKAHRARVVKSQDHCPLRRTVDGDLVDCHGWRLRSSGWDNSCFNLDYLPSQFACSSRGGRR